MPKKSCVLTLVLTTDDNTYTRSVDFNLTDQTFSVNEEVLKAVHSLFEAMAFRRGTTTTGNPTIKENAEKVADVMVYLAEKIAVLEAKSHSKTKVFTATELQMERDRVRAEVRAILGL